MSNKTTFTVEGIAKLDISQVRGAVDQMKKGFQGITLPAGIDKRVAQIFSQMTDEIAEFEVKSKNATTNADWSRVLSSGQKIMGLYQKLQGQVRQLGDLSEKEMQELFPPEVVANIKKAETALKDYQAATKKNTAEIQKQENELAKLQQRMAKKQGKKQQVESQTAVSNAEYKNLQTQQKALGDAAVEAANKLEEARQKAEAYKNSMQNPQNAEKSSTYRNLVKDVAAAEQAYQTASRASKDFDAQMANTTSVTKQQQTLDGLEQELRETQQAMDAAQAEIQSLGQGNIIALNNLFNALSQIKGVDMTNVPHTLEGVQMVIDQLNAQGLTEVAKQLQHIKTTAESAQPAFQGLGQNIDKTTDSLNDMTSMKSQVDQLKNSFMHFFSLTSGWMLLRRGIRQAYETVKELDDAMTEIAVVSEYTLDEIWDMRDGYTDAASDMGVATIDMVNAQKLYIQQGLDLAESTEVAIETIKMARIANLDGAEATNLMTAALRGFNMEMNEANRVNDVYSQLAAKTAADTEEIATAMSKTASIASNAGASFENTSAFLAQIIETTREAPETAGTALKTIIARFQELKKAPSEIGEVDGEMVDANKIETALASAGVALRNTQGEFRNFDDVIIELSGKWNSLDVMTQRYIATMAAGSRQQSRFIALMSDSERLMELTGYAANSAGASNAQFEKTLDSLDSKINRLKNSWGLFLQNLANNQVIKFAVDALNSILTLVNKLTSVFPGLLGSIVQLLMLFGAFRGAQAIINKLFSGFGPLALAAGKKTGTSFMAGMTTGINKGALKIQKVMRKILTMFKTKNFKIQPKVNISPITKLQQATQKAQTAEKAYQSIQKSTTATTASKAKAEALYLGVKSRANAEEQEALATLGLTNSQMSTYNTLRSLGMSADFAATAALGGLTKEMTDEIVLDGVKKGLTADEIKNRLANAGAIYAELGAEQALGQEEKLSLIRKAALAVAFLFGNTAQKKEIATKLGLVAATTAETAADGAQAAAQWTVNIATYAFPGTWLVMIILAIIAVIALLVVGFIALAKAIGGIEGQEIENLKKQSEELGEAAREAEERMQAIADTRNGLRELEDTMQGLVRGTTDWTAQLLKVNGEVLDIIAKYPELQKYMSVNDNGALTISDEGFDKLISEQQHAANTARIAQLYTNNQISQLETDQQVEDVVTNRARATQEERDARIKNLADNNLMIAKTVDTANAVGGMVDWTRQAELDINEARDTTWGRIIEGVLTLGMSEVTRAATLGVTGASSYEELTEREQNGGLSHAEFKQIAIEAANRSIVATDGINEEERKKLQEIIDAEGLDISINNLVGQITGLGNSFDQLAISAAAAANAEEAQRDAALRQIATDAGLAETQYLEQAIGMADVNKTFEDTDAMLQEKKDELGSKNDDELKKKYSKQTGLKIDEINAKLEDKSLSMDTIRTSLATEAMNKEISDKMQTTVQTLEKMNTKSQSLQGKGKKESDAFMNLLTDEGRGLTTQQLTVLKETGLGGENVTADQVNAKLKELYGDEVTLDTLGIDIEAFKKNISNAQATLDDAYAKAANLGIKDTIQTAVQNLQDSVSGLDLTVGQTKQLADAMVDIEVRGGNINAFNSNIEDLLSTITNPEDLTRAQALLTSTDFSSAQSIKELANSISDMGYDIDTNVVDNIIEASKASRRFDLSKLKEEIESTMELIKDLRERDRTDIEIDKETYQKIVAQAPELKTQFIFDGANYQYIGGDVRTIADILADILIETQRLGIEEQESMIKEGKAWQKENETNEDLINSILDNTKATNTIDENQMRQLAYRLNIGATADDTAEVVRKKLQDSYNATYGGGDTLKSLQAQLEQMKNDLSGSQALIKDSGIGVLFSGANNETQGKALDALLKKQAGAMSLYQQMRNEYKKQGIAVDQYDNQIKALAVDMVNLEMKQDDLIQAIEDGGEVLTDPSKTGSLEYNAALESIATVLGDMFGSEGITYEFIQNNQTLFAQLARGGDIATAAWKKLKVAIAQAQMGQLTKDYTANAKNQDFVKDNEMPTIDASIKLDDGNVGEKLKDIGQWFLDAGYSAEEASEAVLSYAKALGYVGNIKFGTKTQTESFSTKEEALAAGYTEDQITKVIKSPVFGPQKPIDLTAGILPLVFEGTKEIIDVDITNAESFLEQFDIKKFLTELNGIEDPTESDSDNDKWQEDYDWLYNLEKKIAKTVRERNKLENEYNLLLTKGNVTQKELLENLRKQEAIENKQLSQLEEERTKRQAEVKALQKEFSDVSQYVSWNSKEQRVVINEAKMRADQDSLAPEFGERIDKAVEEFERIQDELEQIEDDTDDIKTTQAERLREQLDQYAELESRVIDALVSEREKEIEAMEKMNDVISEANSELLDKIQTGIDDARNAREMEEAETDIQDMEQRLALMRSDTSGANALDILKLEEELQQARQDLMDSKIDQAIDELSRQNELAQQQRERQIELAQNQLEVDRDNGAIAAQTNKMLTAMVVKGDMTAIQNLLKGTDAWEAMAAEQKKQWVDELTTQITNAIIGRSKGYAVSKTNKKGDTITFTDKNNKKQKGTLQADGTIKVGNTTYSNVFLGADGKYYQKAEGKIMNTSKPTEPKRVVPQSNTSNGTTDVTDLVKKRVALAIWNNASGNGWGNGDARKNKLTDVFGSKNAKDIQTQVNRGWKTLQKEAGSFKYSDYSYTNMKNKNWKKYETGGLADFTGPAWLDGTKARPEYVLNAEQTQAFLKLVNMLGDFDDNQTAGGNNYYDIKIEVDELANDYDVEQLMDKMKRLIADDAAYRNVNSIDLGRR